MLRHGPSSSLTAKLDELHRCAVMLEYGKGTLVLKDNGKGAQWYGPCARCHRECWLQVSHICPKGQYRSLRHHPGNAIPLCFHCHIHWWHKNPVGAATWGERYLGQEQWKALWILARGRNRKMDSKLVEAHLRGIIRRLDAYGVVSSMLGGPQRRVTDDGR